jgi:hypothetical protein
VQDWILRDVFVQDADLVDAVHQAPQLRNVVQASPPVSFSHFQARSLTGSSSTGVSGKCLDVAASASRDPALGHMGLRIHD